MNRAMMDGFVDELGKLKLAGVISESLIANFYRNPVKYYAAKERMRKGMGRYRETERALQEGYPAGWVPMGIHPGDPLR